MQILYGPDFKIDEPTVVAVGKFDGLHSGHIKIIEKLLQTAKSNNLKSVVYTFNINPKLVLNNESFTPLMTNEEKSQKLSLLGIDYVVYENFNTKFADTLPEEFVRKVLIEKLNAKSVIMGENSSFGKGGSGNAGLMNEFGNKYGFSVKVVKLIKENGVTVSSTRIREKN